MTKLRIISKGGPGSGHHDHVGRPGEIGGSLPDNAQSVRVLTDFVDQLAGAYTDSQYSVIKEHGQLYKPQPLPKGYPRGKQRECFKNAYQLSNSHNLQYVEGIAFPDFADIPIEHAWCVDSEGNVIDNTWPVAGKAYYGIPFDSETINAVLAEKGTYGVISVRSEEFRKRYFKEITHISIITKGGPGSGHFDHAGRLGMVGGSLPEGRTSVNVGERARPLSADGSDFIVNPQEDILGINIYANPVKEFSKKFGEAELEHCYVIDQEGKIDLYGRGDTDSITIPLEELGKEFFEGKHYVHNHPQGTTKETLTALSSADVHAAVVCNMKKMSAVRGNYMVTLEAPPTGWPSANKVYDWLGSTNLGAVGEAANKAARQRGYSEIDSSIIGWNAIWTYVAQNFGGNYTQVQL